MKKESSISERNEKDSCRIPLEGFQIEGTAKGMHSLACGPIVQQCDSGGRHGRSHFTIFLLLVFLVRHTHHKSAKPKSDNNKPSTTYPTKYLRQYLADEDVSSNHPLPMYVGMLAV